MSKLLVLTAAVLGLLVSPNTFAASRATMHTADGESLASASTATRSIRTISQPIKGTGFDVDSLNPRTAKDYQQACKTLKSEYKRLLRHLGRSNDSLMEYVTKQLTVLSEIEGVVAAEGEPGGAKLEAAIQALATLHRELAAQKAVADAELAALRQTSAAKDRTIDDQAATIRRLEGEATRREDLNASLLGKEANKKCCILM